MFIKQLVILVCLGVLSGCAGTSEGNGEASSRRADCIHQPSIRGYRVLDEQNLIIDASARKKYHVTLQRRAYGLRNTWGIGFVESASGRICAGFGEIVFNDSGIANRYRIASIRRLTPEEEEGLLISFGLKEPEVERMPVPQEVEGADIEELDPDANE
jgi:hypothetical protein